MSQKGFLLLTEIKIIVSFWCRHSINAALKIISVADPHKDSKTSTNVCVSV